MLKNSHIWLPDYLSSRKLGKLGPTPHVFFCFVDHYEPLWAKPALEIARNRTRYWRENYPKFASRLRDADGRPPQHSFFFPAEEYRPEFLNDLAELCRQGYGEVEIHLHHRNDTAENLRNGLLAFKKQLQTHGFLSQDRYGFIHGNWCLDNSRRDGDWCGVNNELQILRETGCYADFTLPSAPSDTQTKKVNAIYYATDDPLRPKSHNTGVDVRVGGKATGDLMIVQGPLALNWRRRKFHILPRIEHADVSGGTLPTTDRIDLWVRQRIGVIGKPDWVFVKVHTHGCQEGNFDTVLGATATRMHEYLANQPFQLHYVTAREVYNLIKAAEAGLTGDPNQYRDFILPPPPVRAVS
ncbi:MAG: hypothetical protein WCH84_10440 [Verrucomicrobiota bacterium]